MGRVEWFLLYVVFTAVVAIVVKGIAYTLGRDISWFIAVTIAVVLVIVSLIVTREKK